MKRREVACYTCACTRGTMLAASRCFSWFCMLDSKHQLCTIWNVLFEIVILVEQFNNWKYFSCIRREIGSQIKTATILLTDNTWKSQHLQTLWGPFFAPASVCILWYLGNLLKTNKQKKPNPPPKKDNKKTNNKNRLTNLSAAVSSNPPWSCKENQLQIMDGCMYWWFNLQELFFFLATWGQQKCVLNRQLTYSLLLIKPIYQYLF